MRSAYAVFAVMAVGAGFAGCNCGGYDSTAVTEYCNELAAVQCDQQIACGWTSASARELCLERTNRSWPCTGLAKRIEHGTAKFNQEAADRCLEQARENAKGCDQRALQGSASAAWQASVGGSQLPPMCELPSATPPPESSSPPPSCGEEATPNVTSGETCLSSDDCLNPDEACGGSDCDLRCRKAGVLDGPCGTKGCEPGLQCDFETGTCKQSRAIGDACDVPRHPCDPSTSVCVSGTCQPLPTEGQPCGSSACARGLVCERFHHDPPTCLRRANEGESCANGETCVDSLWCFSGTCQRLRNEGEPCSFFECRNDLFCANGVCAPRHGAGEPCDARRMDPFPCVPCQAGLTCDPIAGSCQPLREAGEGEICTGTAVTCADDEDSCRGAEVNADGGVGQEGRCERKAVGAPCKFSGECPSGSTCIADSDGGTGVCTEAMLGSPCFGDRECLSDQVCGEDQRCRGLLTEGETCVTSLDQCEAPLQCLPRTDGMTFVCARLGEKGDACDPDVSNACKYPFGCVDGRCAEVGALGQPCLLGDCFEGGCEGGNLGNISGTCRPYLPDGAACQTSFNCASGRCIEGKCTASCG